MPGLMRRFGQGLVSLFLLFTAVFFLIRLVPGDPAMQLAGPSATPETLENLRERLGLNQPLLQQYLTFFRKLAAGDLGLSISTSRPVMREVLNRLPNTALLAASGMLLALVVGINAGIMAALRKNTLTDVVLTILAVIGVSIPTFWVAILLINYFSVTLNWLPSFGMMSWRSFILPSIVIAATQVGLIMRVVRSSMIEAMSSDYVGTARAKGASRMAIVWRHAFPNTLAPTVTVICVQIGVLLSGAVVTETVFSWPGVGSFLVQSVLNRDYPSLQALLIVFGVIFICVNLLADILNPYLDPRLRAA